MSVNKFATERNQKAVLELATKPGNDACADCRTRNPRWASHNLGIFICVNCASIHRKIGTHITKVKSLTLDTWSKEQVENMRQNGNIKSNAHYNPNEIRHPPPTNMVDSERDSELEKFIRDKYEYKRFISRSAIVAQHLGPSRSAASVRSNTSGSSSGSVPPPTRSQTVPMKGPGAALPSPPSSATLAARAVPSRSFTSAAQPQPPQPAQPPKPAGGVWDDLVALQSPSQPPSNSSLPLQYQSTTMAQPFRSNTLPQGQFAGVGSSPNFGLGGGVGASGLTSSQFQPQMQSPTAFGASPGGVANPFAQMVAQQQQQQPQQFLSAATPFSSQAPSFAAPPFNQQPQVQQPSFTSPGNPFFNASAQGQTQGMLTPQPQMPLQSTPSPAPFAAQGQFQPPQQPRTPFMQQQQQQPQFQQQAFQPQSSPFQPQSSPFQPQSSPFQQQTPSFQQQTPSFQPQSSPFQQQVSSFQPSPQGQFGMQQGAGAANPFTSWMTQQQQPGGFTQA
ncbi:ArfGap-domain-containing protein, partial [Auriscalpium vulgare]